jgi:hypothetical protein
MAHGYRIHAKHLLDQLSRQGRLRVAQGDNLPIRKNVQVIAICSRQIKVMQRDQGRDAQLAISSRMHKPHIIKQIRSQFDLLRPHRIVFGTLGAGNPGAVAIHSCRCRVQQKTAPHNPTRAYRPVIRGTPANRLCLAPRLDNPRTPEIYKVWINFWKSAFAWWHSTATFQTIDPQP